MTTIDQRLLELLRRAYRGIGPYRQDVVLIGGLVQFFYPLHSDFTEPPINARATLDVDLATGPHVPLRGGRSIRDSLIAEQLVEVIGLQPGLGAEPAASYYQRSEDGDARISEVHLEFISPLRGPDRDSPVRPQRDLLAHGLRRIDLLLDDPLEVEADSFGRIRLPHPLAFIAQKTLIRRPLHILASSAKDAADALYVMWGFRRMWPQFTERFRLMAGKSTEQRTWMRDMVQEWERRAKGVGTTPAQEIADFYGPHGQISVTRQMIADIITGFLTCCPRGT